MLLDNFRIYTERAYTLSDVKLKILYKKIININIMKKTKNLFITFVILIVLAGSGLTIYSFVKDQKQQEVNVSGGVGSSYDTKNLIGTGFAINSGIASTTDQSTVFQFPTSTNDVYWDTHTDRNPQLMAPTSSPILETKNAELITFNVYYKPAIAASELLLSLFASNQSGCQVASSTLNSVEWFNVPLQATTSPGYVATTGSATTSILFTGDNMVKHSFTIKDINYNCLKLVVSNNSTTDGSLLYVNARIK